MKSATNSLRLLGYLFLSALFILVSGCKKPLDAPSKQHSEKKYVRGFIQVQLKERSQSTHGGVKSIYIPGVSVTLIDIATNQEVGKVETDLSGRFSFPAQAKGDYKLCWKADGYHPDCMTNPVKVKQRPVNVGDVMIRPMADYEKNVVIYGRVQQRDEQTGRTLQPVITTNAFVNIEARDTKGDVFYKTIVNNFGDYVLPNVSRDEKVVSVTASIEKESTTRQTYKETIKGGSAQRVDITLRNHVPRIHDVIATVSGKQVEYAQAGDVVQLSVNATDVDGDALSYNWILMGNGGTLSTTTGATTTWTLPPTKGLYTAQVQVGDEHGGFVISKSRLSVGVDKASFSGQVVDGNGSAIAGANVSIGGTPDTAVTNATGHFVMSTSLANRYTLNIYKQGFGPASRIYNRSSSANQYKLYAAHISTVDPTKDIVLSDPNKRKDGCAIPAVNRVDWKNFPTVDRARQQDKTGKIVGVAKQSYQSPWSKELLQKRAERQCGPGIEIKIPANSLIDDSGNAPTGPVTVELSTVDLLAQDSMPGDYSASDGSYLESYGAGSVTIHAGGVSYQKLKPGAKALLRIPVSDLQLAAGGTIPATIPKLVYNNKTGLWDRELVFKLDASGKFYEAEVTHFSSINTDIQKTGQSCVRIKAQGMPTPFKLDVLVPMPGAAPVQRTGEISANDQYDLIINLPNNRDITLLAYSVVDNKVVPHGLYTVNTGGPQTGTPTAPNFSQCQTKVILAPVAEPTPGPDAFLTGLYSFFATRVIENNGTVIDPTVLAQLQSATISYYNTADPRGRRSTFDKFKQANGFGASATTLKSNYGPIDEVRAAYANAVDLGFGRDMHGKRTLSSDGQYDTAFYVTNYGDYDSNDEVDQLDAANQNPLTLIATVAMEWSRIETPPATPFSYYDPANVGAADPNDPTAPLSFESADRVIKFYAYGQDGNPLFVANLDTRGARPIPQLCMVCHGGVYASGNTLGTPAFSAPADVKFGSVMLPFDTHGFVFNGSPPSGFTKSDQQLEFHELNKMVVDTQPGAAINEIIDEMYSPTNPLGANTQIEDFVVTGWSANGAHKDMYSNVIKPACRVCHSSRPLEDLGSGVTRDLRMHNVQSFLLTQANGGIGQAANTRVCVQRVMPHALATYERFWHSYNPISPLEGTMYQPTRLQAFFDGVVKPAIGVNLQACVTTPAVDESVVEEPITLTTLQSEVFDGCSGCHDGTGNSSTFPFVNLDLDNGATFGSVRNVNAQESSAGHKRIKPNDVPASYLHNKVAGGVGAAECNVVAGASGCTDGMPPSSGSDQATQDDIAEWINNNAENN